MVLFFFFFCFFSFTFAFCFLRSSSSFFPNKTNFVTAAEDLSITKIAGLTWEQWNERLALPLVTTLREGAHPLVFPRDLCVSTMEMKSERVEERSPNGSLGSASGNGSSSNAGNGAGMQDGFTCPDCGRMYKLKSSLRNHQKWECGKEPQFQCPYCVYRAKQRCISGVTWNECTKRNSSRSVAMEKSLRLKKLLVRSFKQLAVATSIPQFNSELKFISNF